MQRGRVVIKRLRNHKIGRKGRKYGKEIVQRRIRIAPRWLPSPFVMSSTTQ